ncbi:MAG: SusC/RagA family TonB-linked outer membrane protein [Chryseolinea sp.]
MNEILLKKVSSLAIRPLHALLTAAACLLLVCASYAQTTVTGKVTAGEDASPLPGVNILVKGSTQGTISDADGKFSVTVPSSDVALLFSFVGYVTQEVSLTGRSTVDVVLASDARQLNEVVITALGVEKDKGKLGYAVQEVKGADLVKAREPNAINSLVGKVAGLNIGASSEILGAPNISLRGRAPVYVVDGVPIRSDTWNISPDDIESYTVLKGPTASAIYGTQGVDGAIIITTKRGSKDKRGFAVDFNSSTMWENSFLTIPKVQDLYGPGDHGRYAYKDGKGGYYDSDYDVWGPRFNGQLIPQYDGEVSQTETYQTIFPNGNPGATTDWGSWEGNIKPTPWVARGKDNLQRFLNPGLLSTNNVAISASGDKYDLRFSYSHSYQKGMVPNTELNSDNFNVSTGFDFSDKLRFESNINYNHQYTPNIPDVQYGPNSMIYNITIWGAADWDVDDMKDYWEPGKEGIQQKYEEHTRYNNPYFLAYEWLRGHQKTDLYGFMSLKYKFNDHLELMGRSQVTSYDVLRTEKFPYSATVYGREIAKGDYREDRRTLIENNTDFLMTFNKDVAHDLNLNVAVGGNMRTYNYHSTYTTTNYLNVPASSLTPGAYRFDNSLNPVQAYNYHAPMSVYSGYYTIDASFRHWLNLSATGRLDKHSTLPSSKNSYFYPSVTLSGILSEAIKMPEVISFLKVRAAYAKVGRGITTSRIGPIPSLSTTGNPLGYGSTYTTPYDGPDYFNSAVYTTPLVYNNQPGAYYPNTLTNSNIDPYFSSATEFGADVRFLDNRIGFDITYFNNIDGPQISTQALPSSTGSTGAIANGAKTKRNGLEVVLTTSPISQPNGLKWNVLVNWATFKETYQEFAGGQERSGFYKIGDRTDGYYAAAFYKTQDGQLINDDSGRPRNTAVSQFLGNLNPDWSWGITNKLNYKNWGLTFQFDGRIGGVIVDYIQRQTFRGGRHIETTQGAYGAAREMDALGIKSYVGPGVYVSNIDPETGKPMAIEYDPQTGAITNYDKLVFSPNETPAFIQDYISRYYAAEEANIVSRTYAKLREVTLSYNFPASMLTHTFIRNASISLVGRNLLYFAKKKDFDIDQYATGDSYSSLQTPTVRRYGFNINLTF